MSKATASTALPKPRAGKIRVVIESVSPQIDQGRFPIKRAVGEAVVVEADIFADGHDAIRAVLRYRREDSPTGEEIPMEPLGNDRWRASFRVEGVGRYSYSIFGWVDRFLTWRRDLARRIAAASETAVDFAIGAEILEDSAGRAPSAEAEQLRAMAAVLRDPKAKRQDLRDLAMSEPLAQLATHFPDHATGTASERELAVVVDRVKARFSAWYEAFPRSWSTEPGRHGALQDCRRWLKYVAEMGFDVLYLPPIHPVGRNFRKGRNNTPEAGSNDVGSPWAIGAVEGGHDAIHPQLGTLADFRSLVDTAGQHGIEIAMDLAFQCSPDHPYLRDKTEWFRRRPDGSIQYAENPPKKYQDIYPFDFETPQWTELWDALRDVVLFWIAQGVRIFRVDNPHTKPFAFWEWLIGDIRRAFPDVIFLAEAFTRPKVMGRLAKLGFNQSYTYFAWRNNKQEIIEYLTELNRGEAREYLRPHFWPNTPDILSEYLQTGGRTGFATRLILAATLGAGYGIYGPAFELGENQAREQGSEEYLNSEKYELRHWNLDHPDSLRDLIARVNRIRRQHAALQNDWSLHFHRTDNDSLLCYSKCDESGGSAILAVVNLDPHHTQAGYLDLDLEELGVAGPRPFQVHDQLSEARFLWQGPRNYVSLDPERISAHLFVVRRRVRTERDFDYFM